MKLLEDVYLIGSGKKGLCLTDDLDCHVYALTTGSELVLIDAGAGRETIPMLKSLGRHGFDPSMAGHVLLTHAHADHSGGAAAIREMLGAKIYLSAEEAGLLESANEDGLGLTFARKAGVYPPDYTLPACPVDVKLADGDQIEVGHLRLRAIAVRGHSRGSICYLVDGQQGRYLFSGDTVFCDGLISLLNCVGSSLSDYRQDIEKLRGLGVDALFPSHLHFCLRGGQAHVDKACENFRGIWPPPNIE